MALPYVPTTGVAPADLFEDLTRDLVDQYTAAETRILADLQRRIDRQLTAPEPRERLLEQLQQIRTARESVVGAAARLGIDPELSDRIVRTAIAEGAAAAADRLGLIRILPAPGPLTSTAASATVQVALDLRSSLDDVKQRILRYEQDAYQRLIAGHLPAVLLGTQGSLDAQKAAVAHWLADGIPAFVDKVGRQWAVGSYVEMATRTGLSRAYLEASTYRQQQAGLDLGVVVVGASACASCASVIGKVLTLGSDTGDVVLPDALTGEPTTVHVDGTLSSFRSGHLFGPNCRCVWTAWQPGLSMPVGASTYDPVKEKARDQQRAFERQLRADKRKLALSPSKQEQDELRARIRSTQARLRAHIDEHDLPRKAYREQPGFADGRPTPRTDAPKPPSPSSSPTGGAAPAPRPEPPVPAPVPEPPAPVEQPFRQQAATLTSAEVQEAASTRTGIPFSGFETLGEEGTRDAVSSVVEMLDAFPGVKMTGVSAEITPRPGIFAFVETPLTRTSPTPGAVSTIYHTPRMVLNKLDIAARSLSRDVELEAESGHFHPRPEGATGWQYIVAHEFGHALDANLQNALTRYFRTSFQAALRDIPGKLTATKRREWEIANLSGYGRGSAEEGVAEAFADVHLNGDNARPFSKLIYAEAIRLYGEELAP